MGVRRAFAVGAAMAVALGCSAPDVPFIEVTADTGLGGPVPSYDVALADFDGDGRIDLYAPNHATGAALHRNLGGFRFEDVTDVAGIDRGGDQHGAGWGDADGDGRPDLYVALGANHGLERKANRLYRNAGGRFTDVASEAGATDPTGRGRGVTWVDYDRDGHLDVLVTNFATPNALLRNRGDGTFEDRAREVGVADPPAVHAVWTDYDGDGAPDVLFILPSGRLRLLHNRGDGTFGDVSAAAAIPTWPPATGAAFGDVDGDGHLDLVVTTGRDYPTALTVRDGGLAFSAVGTHGPAAVVLGAAALPPLRLLEWDRPVAPDDPRLRIDQPRAGTWRLVWRGEHGLDGRIGPGVREGRLEGDESWRPSGFTSVLRNRGDGTFAPPARLPGRGNGQAVVLGDVDDDGRLDVVVVHSGVEGADEPDVVYLNAGHGRFGDPLPIPPSEDRTAGAHLVDLDGDGRLDLVLSGGFGSALARARHRVFRNVAPARHWLELALVGRRSNRFGLGTWVTVDAGGRRQVRYHTGGAHFAQDLVPVHVGLGDATVATVTLRWPSGLEETRTLPADRPFVVVEGEPSRP